MQAPKRTNAACGVRGGGGGGIVDPLFSLSNPALGRNGGTHGVDFMSPCSTDSWAAIVLPFNALQKEELGLVKIEEVGKETSMVRN